ncbi:MAG: sensor histidine kinase [Aminivibrio sp.]|jgi:signal transduction histidine kinase|nr:sensor histidine kinase [Synergistaceae bacterium]
MRRHLLLIITFAILLPALAVLLVSGFGLIQHEWAMESVARSYVQDMAENVASRLSLSDSRRWSGELTSIEIRRIRVFTWGPSLPGWVAVVGSDGRVLFTSPGAGDLQAIWRLNIPVGRAVEIKDEEGNLYTVAVNPVSGGDRFVIAAVAWDQLLGPLVRVGRLWPILILLMGVGILLALWALWRWLIMPLKDLVGEIETLNWGRDLPALTDPVAVSEIGSLREVLHRLARTAVERTLLRNRYVNDIVRVQEGEKSRIAMELHDGPIQNITAMIQQIRLSGMARDDAGMREHLSVAEETAQVVVRELREMCDELSPPWIDLGLEQMMAELANRLARHYNISITMDVDDKAELGREKLLSLFRIFQEGVSNAVRHGGATEMKAEIFRRDDSVVFEFRDNGTGFEPDLNFETLRVEGHRGLANMLERMILVGGRLEIESGPGKGALVRCVLPAGAEGPAL